MAKLGYCEKCGEEGIVELHHIVHKSQSKILKDIKINHIYLCGTCHRDNKYGVHNNNKEDRKLKLVLQQKLQEIFTNQEVTLEEVKRALNLKDKELYDLYKLVYIKGNKIKSEELVRVLMGGKLIIGQV